MQRHRVKVSFVRVIGDVDQLSVGLRVDGYLRVDTTRAGGCNHQIHAFDAFAGVFAPNDPHAMHTLRFREFLGYLRSDYRYLCACFNQRQRFARADGAAADNDGFDAFAMQRDWEVTHRNWPRLSDAMRNTT